MSADLLALLAAAHPGASQGDLLAMLDAIPDKKATKKPTQARSGSRPRTDASMERRRSWAFSGRLPQRIAARFTLAETAVLAVIAMQVVKHAACTLTIPHIAALAGVSETTVRNAVREAKAMGLVTVEERRKTAWVSYPNTVRIVSPEWATWLRLTGAKHRTPRPQDSSRKAESRSVTNRSMGFRHEEAAQTPGSSQGQSPTQALPWPNTAADRGVKGQPSMAGADSAKGPVPSMQRRAMHRHDRLRGA